MVRRSSLLLVFALFLALLATTASPAGAFNADVLVTNGSPATPFSQKKQNEPAVAIDAQPSEHPCRGRQ
jgi:hypothetical protein